jgi:hypothetical protein
MRCSKCGTEVKVMKDLCPNCYIDVLVRNYDGSGRRYDEILPDIIRIIYNQDIRIKYLEEKEKERVRNENK